MLCVVGFVLGAFLSPEKFPVVWGKNFLTVPRQDAFFREYKQLATPRKKAVTFHRMPHI